MISGGKMKKTVSGNKFIHEFVPPVGATKMEIVKTHNNFEDDNQHVETDMLSS